MEQNMLHGPALLAILKLISINLFITWLPMIKTKEKTSPSIKDQARQVKVSSSSLVSHTLLIIVPQLHTKHTTQYFPVLKFKQHLSLPLSKLQTYKQKHPSRQAHIHTRHSKHKYLYTVHNNTMSTSKHLLTTLSVLTLLFLLSLPITTSQPPPAFKCTSKSTCKALIGYISSKNTTISRIQNLFQVKTLRSLLGVNNLPLSTPPNFTIPANHTVTIPFPCYCSNGTGISNRVPQYKVVKDDGLYLIANHVFSGLVTYPQIQAVNGIKDANLIIVGQKLWIPLPCSCDDVAGQKVVHYGHVVASGSSVDSIAAQFGTTSQTLMTVNGITDPKQLMAGQVLDVPLKACSSSINSTSLDYPLVVANGTYVFTANNCVMCKCDAANNYTLQCQPSGIKPVNWSSCPAAKCSGNLPLGNSTETFSCTRSTCAYAGYSNQTILTTLADENICPAPSGDSSEAAKIYLRGWSLAFVLLCTQLLMLHRFLY